MIKQNVMDRIKEYSEKLTRKESLLDRLNDNRAITAERRMDLRSCYLLEIEELSSELQFYKDIYLALGRI